MSEAASPAIIVLGPSALPLAERLRVLLPGSVVHAHRRATPLDNPTDTLFDDALTHLRDLYQNGQPIIGLCAAGILIRALGPLTADKHTEPPVLSVAEDGSAVVPLLGGHHGANDLARRIAAELRTVAAITTAGDVRFGLALDRPPTGFALADPAAVKAVTADLLAGRAVGLEDNGYPTTWLTQGGARFDEAGTQRIIVSARTREAIGARATDDTTLLYHPRVLILGLGCERDTDPGEVLELALTTLKTHQLDLKSIACVASLDVKADEPAIHHVAAHLKVPARFFTAERLRAETMRLANPSEAVMREVGCYGVAEGAALAGVGRAGTLLVAKVKSARATCAIGHAPTPLNPAMIGKPRGHLAIIGIGPGRADWRTPAASALIGQAEHLVGYRFYLDLLGPLASGKTRHDHALGDERQRCVQALDLAALGGRVALVCSGDAGIYAMAALVYELLENQADPAWRRVAIEVSPGVSALQAAAARAGAPLGHDFCAISLSDLLTPWTVIEQRLRAAASGDFVVALYNPASMRRRSGLDKALTILRTARPAATPVVVARNLGRSDETVHLVPLDAFDPTPVDMFTTLIIGASTSRLGRLPGGCLYTYTPRGYAVTKEPAL